MSRAGVAVVILLTILFSCEESFVDDCSECYPGGVPGAQLKILYRNPDRIPLYPVVTLYEGPVEDSIIIRKVYLDLPVSFIEMDAILYKDYSATLEFFLEGQKYMTIGGACPKVGYDKTSCEEPCYYVYDNVIDLRIRY